MNKIKGVHIDGITGKISVKVINEDFRILQQVADCDCFDIIRRKISNRVYTIVCDDEGRLKDKRITAINLTFTDDFLVGSLFICNESGENLASLDENEIKEIMLSIRFNTLTNFPILLLGDNMVKRILKRIKECRHLCCFCKYHKICDISWYK